MKLHAVQYMSHHKEGRENDMKKRLIIALALFVMILSACGAVQGTTTATNNSVLQTSTTMQASCSTLYGQQAQLQKAIDTASKELSTAHGDLHKVEEARNTLTGCKNPADCYRQN